LLFNFLLGVEEISQQAQVVSKIAQQAQAVSNNHIAHSTCTFFSKQCINSEVFFFQQLCKAHASECQRFANDMVVLSLHSFHPKSVFLNAFDVVAGSMDDMSIKRST